MWNKYIALLVFTFSFLSFGQQEKARQIVQKLCSEELYGRGYVENGVNKASWYLKQEFENIGLVPFFNNTTYFQDFTFDVNTFPGQMEVTSEDYFYQPGVDFLVDELSGSYRGALNLLELDSTAFEDDNHLVAVFKVFKEEGYNGFLVDLTQFPIKQRKQVIYEFNRLSQVGTIVYLTEEKFTWSVGAVQTNFPIIYIQKEIYTGKKLVVNIEAELIHNFPNVNLAGYIPAKKKNAKTLVFTAHYDHLGAMGTEPRITYFPGGNDNASGTAMLLSLAEYYQKNPHKYNLLFIAFAGEEAGLLGSKYFTENNSMDFENIKFLINLDIMGSGEEGITVVNGSIFKKEFQKLQKINAKNNYLSQVKPRGEAANSDHHYFYKKGVPSIFIYTMGSNKNYHDVFDTYEELSFSAYDNIFKLMVDFVRVL